MPIKKADVLLVSIIGFSLENFKGGKLPLNRAMLQKYLFERKNNPRKETRLIANHLVSEIVENFWLPARIRTKYNKKDCADQIVRLVKEYETLKKIPESRRQVRKVKQKATSFKIKLGSLFDISHTDTYTLLKHSGNDEWLNNWEFLKSQRKFPQVGSMAGVDKILAEKERQRYIKLQYQERKKRKELLYINEQQLKCLPITDNNEVNKGDEFFSDITEEDERDKSFSVKEKKRHHCK